MCRQLGNSQYFLLSLHWLPKKYRTEVLKWLDGSENQLWADMQKSEFPETWTESSPGVTVGLVCRAAALLLAKSWFKNKKESEKGGGNRNKGDDCLPAGFARRRRQHLRKALEKSVFPPRAALGLWLLGFMDWTGPSLVAQIKFPPQPVPPSVESVTSSQQASEEGKFCTTHPFVLLRSLCQDRCWCKVAQTGRPHAPIRELILYFIMVAPKGNGIGAERFRHPGSSRHARSAWISESCWRLFLTCQIPGLSGWAVKGRFMLWSWLPCTCFQHANPKGHPGLGRLSTHQDCKL